jgi:putative transposase
MTQPRCILKGATYLVTRRCVDRQFLLTPQGRSAEIFGYCLAKSIKEHGLLLHGVMTMPNHYHSVITDPHGAIDEQCRDANSLSARSLNAHHDRWESMWSSQGLSLVRLDGPEDVMEKLVYLALNPVKAGLVDRPADWPGLRTLPSHALHQPRILRRPKTRFFANSHLPEEVELEVTVPPQFSHLCPEEFVRQLQERVQEEVEALRAERQKQGKSVMGARAVQRQPRHGKPRTPAQRRQRDPAIACKNTKRRIELLREQKTFRTRYQDCRKRRAAGEKNVLFPAGTLLLARQGWVICERAPPWEHQAA